MSLQEKKAHALVKLDEALKEEKGMAIRQAISDMAVEYIGIGFDLGATALAVELKDWVASQIVDDDIIGFDTSEIVIAFEEQLNKYLTEKNVELVS